MNSAELYKVINESEKYSKILSNILLNLGRYTYDNNMRSLVLGISGGIDSALVAALARIVCDQLKNGGMEVRLIGRSLAINSAPEEMKRAEAIGYAFCDNFETEILDTTYWHLLEHAFYNASIMSHTEIDQAEKIRRGNIKARIRMIKLFDLAHRNQGMVLSTDNFTEYLLGFWTLHGDVGNYGPVQHLWKTEIYRLTEHIMAELPNLQDIDKFKALDDCMKAVPTDGLGITDSDLDQIGAESYAEVDKILYSYIYNENEAWESHPTIQMHLKTGFKRLDPLNIDRTELLK